MMDPWGPLQIEWLSGLDAWSRPILIDGAIKGFLLLGVAAVSGLILRSKTASIRHLVWMLAVVGILCLPVISSFLPHWEIPAFPTDFLTPSFNRAIPAPESHPQRTFRNLYGVPATEEKVPASSPSEGLVVRPGLLPSGRFPPSPETGSAGNDPYPSHHWLTWVQMTWLVGVLFTLLPLIFGMFVLKRLCDRAKPIRDPVFLAKVRKTAGAINVKRVVPLFESSEIHTPMTCGFFRPKILLPANVRAWPEQKQRIVLLHELAHIRRKDCLTQLLGRLAAACHWFNPLAWWAQSRLRAEGEKACDDVVIGSGLKPHDYASCLLEIAHAMRLNAKTHAAALAMVNRSLLENRLRTILDTNRHPGVSSWRARLSAICLSAMLLFPLAVVRCTEEDPVKAKDPLFKENRQGITTEGSKGEKDHYLVLAGVPAGDPFYAAAELLADWRGAEILSFDPEDLSDLPTLLSLSSPRFVGVVVRPESIDTNFIRRFFMMSTRLDEDPFCDFSWGYLTGATADEAIGFIEKIIQAEKDGLPRKFLESGVINDRSGAAKDCGLDWLRESGFGMDQIYWGLEDERAELESFVHTHFRDFEDKGLIQVTGCGDPERIWLFEDERNSKKEKHWDYDPEKIGWNPGGEMYWIDAAMIRRLNLYPAVLTCGTGYSGTTGKVYFQEDL
ncbi:MAG: M56 family metallopeptidase, partial [Planctomycetes bacterium]|nr:M56 family metallopeptidase [Planctomycetota bacterium]